MANAGVAETIARTVVRIVVRIALTAVGKGLTTIVAVVLRTDVGTNAAGAINDREANFKSDNLITIFGAECIHNFVDD